MQKTNQHKCQITGFNNTQIIEKLDLAPSIVQFKLAAPLLADKAEAGQFIVLRMDEMAERLPLTIADFSKSEGWISVIFQAVGASTRRLAQMITGDVILDLAGPLGEPSQIENYGSVVCVGGGVGVAPVYPVARALHEAGNRVISIIGAKNSELLILEKKMRAISSELFVCTDDGSTGHHGFVTQVLKELLEKENSIKRVWAIGPVVMMDAVCRVTDHYRLHTEVSLNSIMVDGSGMCGACRVEVGGQVRFVCVDGPEFDGHKVNFNELITRQSMYVSEEKRARWNYSMVSGEQEIHSRPKQRVDMPCHDPRLRIRNFDEVALGYSPNMARSEASRCLQCKKQPCVQGCPVDVPIPRFIKKVSEGKFLEAAERLKNVNILPAICGRVCPQESQCEKFCVLAKKGNSIAIGRLERFVADYQAEHIGDQPVIRAQASGKRVAVIGSGPAGLSAAADLAKEGHETVMFEAFHRAGGVLVYGIPEFRMPKAIVQREVGHIEKLGVTILTSCIIGRAVTIEELLTKQGFDAIFIGTGAGLPYFLNIPGENLNGVYTANEFLTRVNLMRADKFPEYDTPVRIADTMAVVGGGNVAMDAARVSLRLGAKKVYCIYRRSRDELPARMEEVIHAEEEGVEFRMLTGPVAFTDNGKGWLSGVKCLKMKLGEADKSGRRRPVPIEGSEHVIPVEVVIIAIGQGPNPLLTRSTKELSTSKHGTIIADPETGQTNMPGVFAGGDIVTGAATVILAMGAGRKAARAINAYLRQ